jgi:hypothetical protein
MSTKLFKYQKLFNLFNNLSSYDHLKTLFNQVNKNEFLVLSRSLSSNLDETKLRNKSNPNLNIQKRSFKLNNDNLSDTQDEVNRNNKL